MGSSLRVVTPTCCALVVAIASASAARAPAVTVTGGWLRFLTGAIPAGGYFVLRNDGAKPLVLTGARSPDCGAVMLHQSSDSGGMSMMRAVSSLPVAAGGTLRFAPGGYHLMCMQPAPTLRPGASVPFTLEFADGSTVAVPLTVRGATGR